jgi:signal transduction histidine kinase
MKREFMAMIIHDIRSPLNSVSCMLDQLDLEGTDKRQARAARTRKNANQSIAQVSKQNSVTLGSVRTGEVLRPGLIF